MTDGRVSAGWVQVLTQNPTPEVRVSTAWVQVLFQPGTGRPPLRTAGSSRPVQMLWPDLTWRNVLPKG